MHFSKTYHQLLVSLPPELRDSAFDYRKLKRLINRTASELDLLGLGPSVLRRSSHDERDASEDGSPREDTSSLDSGSSVSASHRHSIVYEIVVNSSALEPRLRLSPPCNVGMHHDSIPSKERPVYHVHLSIPEQSFSRITQTLFHPPDALQDKPNQFTESYRSSEMVIPLPSDTEFFHLLTSTLSALANRSDILQDNFNSALASLAESISSTALPASSSSPHSFEAYSSTKGNIASLHPVRGDKSDLYTWREIFQLYAEAEVFESVRESTPGERSIEEVEKQLDLFKGRVLYTKVSLVLPGSKDAFDTFLKLNVFILNVKKLQLANSEATRKILKKHAKRTTFPVPSYLLDPSASTSATSSARHVSLTIRPAKSLPRLLVQAIGEVLLPVVPHIDDYTCLICTAVAFKPVRLSCGHFFCVRCLVKLQRRHLANCPMCRAPTVLQATPSNIDYGLLNFVVDWFPIECREKLHANEEEVTREQLEALGIEDAHVCRIM